MGPEFPAGQQAGQAPLSASSWESNYTPASIPADQLRSLIVERKRQFMNSAAKYIVTVDGVEVGRLNSGESLRTQVREHASIMLVCEGIFMKSTALLLRVRTGNYPCVHFSTVYGGGIKASTSDIQVLETLKGKAAYR